MKVYIDRKPFPFEVKSVTCKRHYIGSLPRGWEYKIEFEHDGDVVTFPVYVMGRRVDGQTYHLFTPNTLEMILASGVGLEDME